MQITSLFWSQDDSSIVSTGSDGAVYERRWNETTRRQDYVQKGYKFFRYVRPLPPGASAESGCAACLRSAVRSEDGKIYAVGDEQRDEQKASDLGLLPSPGQLLI